jgi:hypothetical protein
MSLQYPGGLITKNPVTPSGPFANSTASGVWTLEQQAYWQKLGQWPTAGNTANYIEDVFSTYIYTGNSSIQSIPNGINLGPNTGNSNYFNAGQINTNSSTSAFDLGTSDWTVECWIKTSYTSRIDPYELNGGTSSGFFGLTLNRSSTGDIEWNESSGGSSVAVITATGTTVANDSWHNIAITRSGNSVRLFFDGTQVGSTYTTSYTYGLANNAFRFGNRYPGGISSSSVFYISNFRIVKGTALYTTTFTPSTQPLTQISGTSYLGAQSLSSAVDTTLIGNSYANNVTPNGNGPFSYGTGSGGLVWTKGRSNAYDNTLVDTVRGVSRSLVSNATSAEDNSPGNYVTTFNNNGFSVGGGTGSNGSGATYASWTFRKQPKFFDIVTYTGNQVAGRTVAHNLGSVPGFIVCKRIDTPDEWFCYHRSLGPSQQILLNSTAASGTNLNQWNNTAPTASVFSLGTDSGANGTGGTYVAYLFAHNAGGFGLSGTENVISCGSMAVGGGVDAVVNLGYEPQWVMFKQAQVGGSGNWRIVDNMRGVPTGATTGDKILSANLATAETDAGANLIDFTSTGFIVKDNVIQGGDPYIYIAIRRGPMAVPTTGASVFVPYAYTGNGSATRDYSAIGIVTDMNWTSCRSNDVGVSPLESSRLQGNTTRLQISSTSGEDSGTYGLTFNAYQNGVQGNSVYGPGDGWNSNAYTYIGWNFRRAPGFFDQVCYTGTGSSTTQAHNLAAVPEMMIIRRRTGSGYLWVTYTASQGNTKFAYLNSDQAFATDSYLASTTPTSSVFTVGTNGDVNASGATYIAYLFATVAGVSKVGSYTGTGTTAQINCGFTTGARFVMIKRADSTGGWYIWDSARGIVSGNDPYLLLNSTSAEATSTDYVDTYSSGFEISSTAPAAINASGGTFIFLAIA